MQANARPASCEQVDGSSEGQTTHAAVPAIDVEALPPLDASQLVHRCLGSLDLVARLLANFEQRLPKELSEIEECFASGDSSRLARLAHQLKGATANVSALALHAVATKLEHHVRANDSDAVAASLRDIRAAWDEFRRFKSVMPLAQLPRR